MAKLALLGIKLRRRDKLLAQVWRGVDQKPVIAVGADGDRGLGASQLRMLTPGRPANRASAIPLRYTAACRGAQDDDAKHGSSPGDTSPAYETQDRWTPARTHSLGSRA